MEVVWRWCRGGVEVVRKRCGVGVEVVVVRCWCESSMVA